MQQGVHEHLIEEAMELMLLSFVGPAVQDLWNLSPRQVSIISSVVFAGMMLGAYSWGVLSDMKGRRIGFFATAVLTFVAGFSSTFSPNYYSLLLLRGLVGVGLGGGPVFSSWFMEFTPSPNRGMWMVIFTLFWTFGSIFEAALAWVVMPSLGWRWLLGLSSLPLIVLLAFYPLVPESPRYSISKGETDKALNVLETMARVNRKQLPVGRLVPYHNGGNRELEQVSDLQVAEAVHLLPNLAAVTDKTLRKQTGAQNISSSILILLSPSLLCSTMLLWFVFFSNAFTYYGLVLLTSQLSGGGSCGVHTTTNLLSTNADTNLYRDVFVTSFAELPGLVVAAAIVDRVGRKHSMAGLFGLCGLFLLPLLYRQPETFTTFLLFGARACIMGSFTILYIYAPEVYPTRSRSTGLGIANSFARIGGLLCPLVAVDLVQNCHQFLAVTLFTIVPVLATFATMCFPKETKGCALSDTFDDR
ncbi:hypothetical protein O6H91_16G049700 [Diphasiastrum complanatum]|uniref:Uncharacterized protein n=1 Tax=Diphasiastrum complanatum TaxID=34168 RepID=A0ACC2BC77_DIPCM|nr:hypothetical protein O6H91_16G049700 [Diphasiastrum complanatum]